MSKQIEKLSKNLAQGMPRRKAFMVFFSGVSAALLGARGAKAGKRGGVQDICVEYCRDLRPDGVDFGACVAASAHCPEGWCAALTSGGFVCVPATAVSGK